MHGLLGGHTPLEKCQDFWGGGGIVAGGGGVL